MGYHASNFGSPHIYNWMDATAHEQAVQPIRGKPDCKPIGNRRKTYATIRRLGDESVACNLYQTDVVTYYKDGSIEICLDGYATQSTMAFISEVLGVKACIAHKYVWIGATLPGQQVMGWYALDASGVNKFVRNGSGDLEYQNHFKVSRHRINRAGANNVRKAYKAFKDYVVRSMRLRDEGFSSQEFGDIYGWVKPDLPAYPTQLHLGRYVKTKQDEFMQFLEQAQSQDPATQYKACLWLARSASRWMRNDRWTTTAEDMLKQLDEIILYAHRDQCFELAYEGAGDFVKDPYAKFFDD